MHYFFLLLVLLVATGAAVAQKLPVATRPDSVVAAPVAPDTAAAIHRLFAGRRQRRDIIAASLGLSLVAGTIGSLVTAENPGTTGGRSILNLDGAPGSSSGNTGSQSSTSGAATGWVLCAALPWPFIAIDYAAYADYSRKREKKAVAAYEAGHLSSRIRKELLAKYLQPIKAD